MGKDKTYPWEDIYEKIDEIGEGGNGKVFKVKRISDGKVFALKNLENRNREKKCRFIKEICSMIKFSKKTNVIPIVDWTEDIIDVDMCSGDTKIKVDLTNEDCVKEIKALWYVMPKVKPIMKYILEKKCDVEEIVDGVIQIVDALEVMHSENVYHRDIKPDNILIDETSNKWYLADFGIAKFEEDSLGLTRDDRAMGAVFTIAPEMKRNPKTADGKKADVFSLAKTLWMLLKQDEYCFDGEYNFNDEKIMLRSKNKSNENILKEEYLVELEELLVESTKNDPSKRPTLIEFKKKLEEWKKSRKDPRVIEKNQWTFLQKQLFTEHPPKVYCWDNLDAIIYILNLVINTRVANHMFVPSGGGVDLKFVEKANESGCIYLDCDFGRMVVKPKNLYFVHFSDDVRWDYLFLELDELEPIFKLNTYNFELLIEDKPGNYINSQNAPYGVYKYEDGYSEGNKLPDGWRVVERYNNGKFLIALKGGYYNSIRSTYDGRHNKFGFYEFNEYIEGLKGKSNELKKKLNGNFDGMGRIVEYVEENYYGNYRVKSNHVVSSRKSRENIIMYRDIINKCDKLFVKDESINHTDLGMFCIVIGSNILGLHYDEDMILCKNNYFVKLSEINGINEEIYLINNRDDAYKLLDKCNINIAKLFGRTKCDGSFNLRLEVKLVNFKKPKHLFSREEFEELAFDADDRVDNVVVVDEEGYIHVLSGGDISKCNSYPARLEIFSKGNCYMGIYSSEETMEYHYIMLLEGWLEYLEKNYNNKDFVVTVLNDCSKIGTYGSFFKKTEDELINKIKKYY